MRSVPLMTAGSALVTSCFLGSLLGLAGSLYFVSRPAPALVEEVTFLGSHPVAADSGGWVLPALWLKEMAAIRQPAWYRGGETMRVAVLLHLPEVVGGQEVLLEGRTDCGLEFQGRARARDEDVLVRATAAVPLAATVRYWPAFQIRWRVSVDGGRTFRRAGISRHRVYVTCGVPGSEPVRETVLEVGCRSADGCSDVAGICGRVWSEFTRRDEAGRLCGVRRADGRTMRYWLAADDPALERVPLENGTLAGMLQYRSDRPDLDGVGTCQAWTELLAAVLAAQGVREVAVVTVAPPAGASGFEMRRLPLAAQGNADPPLRFVNHSLVEVQGEFYDPAYGAGPYRGATEREAIAAWRDATVAAILR